MSKIIKNAVALLLISSILFCFVSCGSDECAYASSRSTEGRDIKYAEINVKDYGTIIVLLDATTAPITVANFVKLAESGFYDGLTFHRIIKDFMIQGGDPKGDGTGGSDKDIKGEFKENGYDNDISHLRGVISMARSNDPDSASSQFFICNADAADKLDGKYAAFGYVIKGMSVVDQITSTVFPKTAYAEFYGDESILGYYGSYPITKHYYWSQVGNGAVTNNADKPIIESIRILDSYEK